MATAHVNVKGRTSMDGRGWSAGLRKMEVGTKGAAARMAGSMAGMIGGVFAVGFLASATRRIVQHADQIHKTAVRIGTSTDTIQKFDFAATQSGATMSDVEKSFINTAKAMESAKQGLTTHIRAFQAFGITMQMLNVMSPEQVFLKVADAIEKAGGAMDNAKSLQDIMGRGGAAMIPAFVSGFTGLAASAPKGIDSEAIESMVRFNDELDKLKREALPLAADAGAVLAEIFQNARTTNDEELSFLNKSAAGAASILSPDVFNQVMNDTTAQKRMGVDISGGEWSGLNERHGKALEHIQKAADDWLSGSNPFLRGPAHVAAKGSKGSDWIKAATDQATADPETADAASTSWSKPSLQLNSLQRIGAAVSQSADPIAIEKDNNKLLKTIAKNTKKLADETEGI